MFFLPFYAKEQSDTDAIVPARLVRSATRLDEVASCVCAHLLTSPVSKGARNKLCPTRAMKHLTDCEVRYSSRCNYSSRLSVLFRLPYPGFATVCKRSYEGCCCE